MADRIGLLTEEPLGVRIQDLELELLRFLRSVRHWSAGEGKDQEVALKKTWSLTIQN